MFDYFQANNETKCIFDAEVSCVSDPMQASLKEIMLHEIKQLAYYILKLKDFNIENKDYDDAIIKAVCSLSFNADINRDEMKNYLSSLIKKRCDAEKIYIDYCEKNNLDCQILKSYTTDCKKFDLLEAIKNAEKQNLNFQLNLDKTRKNLYQILSYLIQNASLTLNELRNCDEDISQYKFEIIKILSSLNFKFTISEKLKSRIEKCSLINYELEMLLKKQKERKFGKISQVDVTLGTIEGKSILVTGDSLDDLYNLLEAIDQTDIHVYTHDFLIFAHCFEKFKKFKNLYGHYQKSFQNLEFDISYFPGTVLITQNAKGNYWNIIRGMIFTTNPIEPKGMKKIENKNFQPLIEATLNSVGFKHGTFIDKVKIGYNIQDILSEMDKLIERIENKEIKSLFLIGLLNKGGPYGFYYDKLIENLPQDSFTISFSFNRNSDRIYHIKSYYDYTLTYEILEKLKPVCKKNNVPLNLILTE